MTQLGKQCYCRSGLGLVWARAFGKSQFSPEVIKHLRCVLAAKGNHILKFIIP